MPSAALAEKLPALAGDQTPRVCWVPEYDDTSEGAEAIGLAADVGLVLDPWQRYVLSSSLNRRADKWAAFEVGLVVPRQNGKGTILEARELAGLFLFDEQLILHSAHEYKTAAEGFKRVLSLVENSDMLRKRVKQVRTSHGEEGIELVSGARLRFIARTGGSGRGFTGDCIILDESFNLPDAAAEALLPTVSARPDPQIWYTSSAPDRDLAPCEPLGRIRNRGTAGGDPGLAYFEWSINAHDDFCPAGCREHAERGDVGSWLRANPGAGIRISVEHMAREFASMGEKGFDRERLGVGNWPLPEGGWQIISRDAWDATLDDDSHAGELMAFAAEITGDGKHGTVAVWSRRPDGLFHVEVVDYRPRTNWMAPRILELLGRYRTCAMVIDPSAVAGSLIAELTEKGVEVLTPTVREIAQACGQFYRAVTDDKSVRHLAQPELVTALAGVTKRKLADAWAWARAGEGVDITPLRAVTLAGWGWATRAHLYDDYDPLDSIG